MRKLLLTLLLLTIIGCVTYEQPSNESTSGYQVGDELIVNIQSVNEQGYGIARTTDLTLLIPQATEDTTVKVRITQLNDRIAFAEIMAENAMTGEVILDDVVDIEDLDDSQPENTTQETENTVEEKNETIVDTTQEPQTSDEADELNDDTTMEFSGKKADIVAFEGELIDLAPMVMDPDGDDITLGFTDPFDRQGRWQTGEGDAGFYSVIITATDNKDSLVTKTMTVNVLIRNKPPQIRIADELTFKEGEVIVIDPDVYDEDGDEVVVTYSGWMSSRSKQTNYNDAGTYTVTIKADDGNVRIYKDVKINVVEVNREPSLLILNDPRIVVTEGETVRVEVRTSDPDGDDVDVRFSAPLDEEGSWTTGEGDEGEYEVTVSATDGTNNVFQELLIEVLKRNTPPVITGLTVSPSEIELKRPGDRVELKVDVQTFDQDGDDLTITYSGFTSTRTRTVSYGEPGGLKTITVTVSDGEDTVSQDITISMNNWPCFDCLG